MPETPEPIGTKKKFKNSKSKIFRDFFFFQNFFSIFFQDIFLFYLFGLGTFDTKFVSKVPILWELITCTLVGKMFKNISPDTVRSGMTCPANLGVRSCPIRKLICPVRLSPTKRTINWRTNLKKCRGADFQAFEVLTSLMVQAVLKWNSPKYWCGNRKWQQILFFVQFLFHPSLFLKRTFSFFSQIHLISSWRLTTHLKTESSSKYTLHNGHQNLYEVAFKFL